MGPNFSEYDVSLSGTLVYRPAAGQNRLVWLDRSGKATPLTESEPGSTFGGPPRLSPDGRRIAVARLGRSGADISVLEVERGTLTRITFEGYNVRPLWSADGEGLFFAGNRGLAISSRQQRMGVARPSGFRAVRIAFPARH
jgi:Tol biopolymer transport system component